MLTSQLILHFLTITHEKFRSSEVGVLLRAVISLEERDGRAIFRGSASSSIGKSTY